MRHPPPTVSPPDAPPPSATSGYLAQLLLTSKGSKQARQDSNNLSHALLKTLDLAYNPKYGKLNPAFKDAAARLGHPTKDVHPEPAEGFSS